MGCSASSKRPAWNSVAIAPIIRGSEQRAGRRGLTFRPLQASRRHPCQRQPQNRTPQSGATHVVPSIQAMLAAAMPANSIHQSSLSDTLCSSCTRLPNGAVVDRRSRSTSLCRQSLKSLLTSSAPRLSCFERMRDNQARSSHPVRCFFRQHYSGVWLWMFISGTRRCGLGRSRVLHLLLTTRLHVSAW